MIPRALLKRAGTPHASRLKGLRSHVSVHPHYRGSRLDNWLHTGWNDPQELNLPDF